MGGGSLQSESDHEMQANLQSEGSRPSILQGRVNHDCYQHYELKSALTAVFTCTGCKMIGFGPRYVCNLCTESLHPLCRYPKHTISHDFFKLCFFTFSEHPSLILDADKATLVYSRCAACAKHICGFHYHCEADYLYLHPTCYKLDKMIHFDGKVYKLNKGVSACCESDYSGWSYVSSDQNCHYHVHSLMEKVIECYMRNGLDGVSGEDHAGASTSTSVSG